MFTIDELIQTHTPDEVLDYLLGLLEAQGVPARSWRTGGVARSILGALSLVGSQGTQLASSLVKGLFVLLAEGDYLAARAKDQFDVDKIQATFATGFVTLTNSGGAVYTVGANELIVSASTTKARYTVTSAFSLAAFGTATVPVLAVEAGNASSVGPGEIDTLETPLTRVTVSNAAAIVGRDAESDDDLRARCLAKRGTWSQNGPRSAYEFAALSALLTSGAPTNISRVSVSPSSSTGTVTVICATPSGTPTSDELAAVSANIEAEARPDSVTVSVQGAVPVSTAHSVIVWCHGGVLATIQARATAALATLIAGYPIGGLTKADGGTGYLYRDAIAAAIINSSPEIYDVDFVDGDEDIALAANEVAVDTTNFDIRIR